MLSGIFPIVKAIQAAVTLGTGCSLGPEGPMVDIGKSCAHGCSVMMENNRERRIALVAAGAAAGISSGNPIVFFLQGCFLLLLWLCKFINYMYYIQDLNCVKVVIQEFSVHFSYLLSDLVYCPVRPP